MSELNDPTWWTIEHESAWQRVKTALRRDWEQTKADLTSGGTELAQSAADTIKQAAGKEEIPPGKSRQPAERPDADPDWDAMERAIRYGCGARAHYGETTGELPEDAEQHMKGEWRRMHPHMRWEKAKAAIFFGWNENRGTMW